MSEPGLTVILTHEHTDFDALASLLATALLFPAAIPVLPQQLNRNVAEFLALYRNQFPFREARELPRQPIARLIIVDTRTPNLPKGVHAGTTRLIIDHHIQPAAENPSAATDELWHEPLGANVTLLIERLREQPLDLSSVQATLLALGIHEDTGSLTYATTTQRDAAALTWLMAPHNGVNLEVLHQFLRHPLSLAQRELLDLLVQQSSFVTVNGHTVVIAQATAPGFADQLSPLAHRLRDIHEADAIFLIVKLGDMVQVVARSVTDDVDVGAVARTLGGGGHRRAAAAPVRDSELSEVVTRITTLISAHSQPAVTVRQIMTHGRPQVLSPDLPLEQAYTLMRRYGHEGYPVVERQRDGTERLLGVLTRRETDRAINHGLGERTVRHFMQTGPGGQAVTVRPDDSIATLRKAMIGSGWGQIPVVDAQNKLIGIVTRTDLIKLWDDGSPPVRHAAEVDRRLRETLAPAQVALLRLVGREVAALQFAVYVVGGFVRDLLLNGAMRSGEKISALDMDIVVEGDAIAFAEHLQRQFGGRLVTHKQFGTAKWILDAPVQPVFWDKLALAIGEDAENLARQLPSHLDFVTARTEFYTAPTVLPTVELSNIKLDLHRRDFTINTLAFCLEPERWGELLDFFGGLSDLRQGVIRVLHSLSFVDDPTRILRAVRYEQRFGFQIEMRTQELLQDAIPLLERVTPARIRHELERILLEAQPEKSLRRLAELNVLQNLHPTLLVDGWVEQQFARLRTTLQQPDADPRLKTEPIDRLYWGLFTLRLPPEAQLALRDRLGLSRETERLMADLAQLHALTPVLTEPNLLPSQVASLLAPIGGVAQALFMLTADDPHLIDRLRQYRDVWQPMRPLLSGGDLQRMGLPPGPLYREILAQLRTAQLDGTIHTVAEAQALVAQLIQQSSN